MKQTQKKTHNNELLTAAARLQISEMICTFYASTWYCLVMCILFITYAVINHRIYYPRLGINNVYREICCATWPPSPKT